jgi:hypothetical protein
MEVWVRIFRIGPDGLELPGTEWIRYVGWDVRDGVITDPTFIARAPRSAI